MGVKVLQLRNVMCDTQEWNEIQYNGVYYHPPGVGMPGEIDPEKAYTFKYPRPPK